MAKETVDKILKSEMSAEKAETDARSAALDMIEKAKADAAEYINKKRMEAEGEAEWLISKAKEKAEEIISSASECGEKPDIPAEKREDAVKACLSVLI